MSMFEPLGAVNILGYMAKDNESCSWNEDC